MMRLARCGRFVRDQTTGAISPARQERWPPKGHDFRSKALVIARHSVGDQKQIFGGIGQDHVQKLPILRVVVTAAAVLLTAFAYQRTKAFSVWIGLQSRRFT